MNIMCVSPHPDDIEYGMGGVLLKLAEKGHQITILVNEKYDCIDVLSQDVVQLRREDALRAAKHISGKVLFFRIDEPLEEIADYIRKLQPQIMIMPSKHETHPIHKITNIVILDAIKTAVLDHKEHQGVQVKQIFYYETFSTDYFVPDFIIDVSKFYVKAKRMLEEHRYGIETLPSLPYKFQLYHQIRGFEASCMYGESLVMDKQAPYSWKENRAVGLSMLTEIF